MARKRTSRPTERDIQRQVKHLLTLAGCAIYDTSQGWRKDPGGTRMTPGLPDLLIFFRGGFAPLGRVLPGGLGFLEVKTPEGLRDHQRRLARRESRAVHQDRFALRCHLRGIPYVMGGVDEAWALLANVGRARREQGQWYLTPWTEAPDA